MDVPFPWLWLLSCHVFFDFLIPINSQQQATGVTPVGFTAEHDLHMVG